MRLLGVYITLPLADDLPGHNGSMPTDPYGTGPAALRLRGF